VSGAAGKSSSRVGPHLLGVTVTWRYRLEWVLVRLVAHSLFRVTATGREWWPAAPFQLTINHHSGWDPIFVMAISPLRVLATAPRLAGGEPRGDHGRHREQDAVPVDVERADPEGDGVDEHCPRILPALLRGLAGAPFTVPAGARIFRRQLPT
jgi:hypothetical protein